jgi:hypothetical protein
MTPKDWFGVLVRGFGLFLLVQPIPQCIALMLEYQGGGPGMGRGFTSYFGGGGGTLTYCAIYFVLGFIGLRFANAIVRFAYPGEPKQWIPPIDDQPPAPHP